MSSIRSAVVAVSLLAAVSEFPAAELPLRLVLPAEKAAVLGRIEIAVEGIPPAANPFDPDSIALDLEARAPSGATIRLPGFLHQDFDRTLKGDRETLTPRGERGWRFRFVPLEPGVHSLTATARIEGKPAGSATASLDVAPAQGAGFARVDEKGKRSFRFDDGTPLFLNGICACWHGSRGTYDYDDWLKAYQEAGMNYIRIWMWPEAFGIEWDRGDRLRYRLDRAWTLDRVLAEAQARGVLVMLCFDYHGMFEVKPDFWGGNNRWPQHPYNAANGGPCADQNEFFTHEQARELYRKRLRYTVARWSAFTNILAWEFFNEIDNVYRYLKHEDVVAWHRDMARHLRSIDPYRHLISSSFTGGSERGELFDLSEMDFSQYHSYNEKHPADMMAQKTARFLERYRKPFFVSEYGTDWRGWKPETDPHLRALHQAVWSGAFTGAAGTGMSWWWESIHAARLHGHWSALAAFLRGSGIGKSDMAPIRFEAVEGGAPVKAYGVATNDEALIWLLDPAFNWPEGAMVAEPPPLAGARVAFSGLAGGAYRVGWWDTLTGKPIAESEAIVSGQIVLAVPPFRADIAGRVQRR